MECCYVAYREQIPIDKGLDHTLTMMREGYLYITNRRNRYGRDLFATRLLGGQKAVCIAGREAAEIFYDETKFKRKGAAPKRIRQSIFGEQAIQTMDDANHKQRKRLFMSFMTQKRLKDAVSLFKSEWLTAIDTWENKEITLYHEVTKILTTTACKWAGVPLTRCNVKLRADQLEALFDSAGAVGPRHWKGRLARNVLELWLRNIISDVRKGKIEVAEETPLYRMAWYQDINEERLNEEIIAVELLNILRPIVAIAVYIVFTALALYEHSGEKERLLNAEENVYEMFIQEVRRYYPFFPYVTARVRRDFLWKGHDFKTGNLVLLDIYGTNHHPEIWDNPYQFKPERFKERNENLFDFIPQGGGDYYKGHRCPGEWLTVEIMKASLDVLVNQMDYEVPVQDLRYSMSRIPSLPKSRFIINKVNKKK